MTLPWFVGPPHWVLRRHELTTEEEYERALGVEVRWDLKPDGTITSATDNPTRGRA